MKNFKTTESPHGILLYPLPVDKNNLFLIKARNAREARLLKYLLDPEYLKSPISSPTMYHLLGLHIDQQTPIFELKWDELVLEFLPHRQVDENRAQILENLMSKKIAKLPTAENPREVVEDLIFRFHKQQECSECDKLGINATILESWFLGLRNLI